MSEFIFLIINKTCNSSKRSNGKERVTKSIKLLHKYIEDFYIIIENMEGDNKSLC